MRLFTSIFVTPLILLLAINTEVRAACIEDVLHPEYRKIDSGININFEYHIGVSEIEKCGDFYTNNWKYKYANAAVARIYKSLGFFDLAVIYSRIAANLGDDLSIKRNYRWQVTREINRKSAESIISKIRKLADQNYPPALVDFFLITLPGFDLADGYIEILRKHSEKNLETSERYLLNALSMDYADAEYFASIVNYKNIYTENIEAKYGLSHIRRLAKEKNVLSMFFIGLYDLRNKTSEKEKIEAKKLLISASDMGSLDASFYLGVFGLNSFVHLSRDQIKMYLCRAGHGGRVYFEEKNSNRLHC